MANPFYSHNSGQPITLSRGSSSTIRAEFDLIQTGFDTVNTATGTTLPASIALKGTIAGQVWTGTHDYTGGLLRVATPVGTADAVTKAYADGLSFATALPAQTGNSGKFVTTNGTNASWATIPVPAFQTAAVAADVKTGTDITKVVTSAAVLGALGFSAYMQTADQTITSAGALTIVHGLGRVPVRITPYLKNVTSESNYVAGDAFETAMNNFSGASINGCVITCDATNIYVRFANTTSAFSILNKSTGAQGVFTNTNWSFFLRAFA